MAAVPSTSAPATAPTAATSSATDGDTGKDNMASPAASEKASDGIPLRTKDSFNKLVVQRYVENDAIGAAALTDQTDLMKRIMQESRDKFQDYRLARNEYRQMLPPSRLYGEGYRGFGNGHTDQSGPPRIIYPGQKPRPGQRHTPPLRYKRKDMLKQAEQHEDLVPIRIEVEWDKVKLRDTLTWNLHERLMTVQLFAAQLIEDLGLKAPAAQQVFDQTVQQMRDQLNDFYPFAHADEEALDPELPYSAYKNDEMRILVKLNITIGQHTLVDQFEWEINNPANSPEEFAASMARDLSLSGEFTTAIAHCIREQSQLFTRSLYSIGHPFDGRPVEDPDLVNAFCQSPLPAVFRPQQQAKDYAPYLYELSEADLERTETILSREQRRQKRSINRRGGPQLPDLKERQRTIRTLIVSSVLPGAATHVDESRLFKRAAGTVKKRPVRDGDFSESEESEDSSADSPAPSAMAGTSRTRGLRGAASTAQQRMATLGRSETPEAGGILHHHETRTSRRFREETEEPVHLIVTLKVQRDKLRRLMKGDYRDIRTPSQPRTPSTPQTRLPSAPAPPRSMPPPPTTSATPNSGSANGLPPGQIGREPAPPVFPGQPQPPPPPPPEWLVTALKELERRYPNGDKFEAMMKYAYLDPVTGLPVQSQPLPEGVKYAWLPRIRCLDCTTKLYTPGPDKTAQKFETHLKFSEHRERVRQRLEAEAAANVD